MTSELKQSELTQNDMHIIQQIIDCKGNMEELKDNDVNSNLDLNQ